ncbi:MAG: C4-type zinc ribbon domain-containing protein [Mycobacterium sp.]
MKADPTQQRALLEMAEIDAELTRLAHRAANLPEQQRCDELEAQHRAASDRVAVLGIALEDLEGQVQRLESEIDGVRQREDRDRALLASPDTNAKQLAELQHELETLQRRQSALEDSELEIMERREQLQSEQGAEQENIDTLAGDLTAARHARNEALAEIEQTRDARAARRSELTAALDAELVALYDRVGAGALQGKRCGACRIEIDRGELSRIAAAADDEVLRCPECGAILLRVKGTGA